MMTVSDDDGLRGRAFLIHKEGHLTGPEASAPVLWASTLSGSVTSQRSLHIRSLDQALGVAFAKRLLSVSMTQLLRK